MHLHNQTSYLFTHPIIFILIRVSYRLVQNPYLTDENVERKGDNRSEIMMYRIIRAAGLF